MWYIYNYSIIHSGFTVQILYEHKFSPHLGKYLGMQLLDDKVRVCFKFVKKLPNCLLKWIYHFAFIPTMNGSCFVSLLTFDVSTLDFSSSNSCEVVKWRRKWQPTPLLFPGESHDRGIWWATVHGLPCWHMPFLCSSPSFSRALGLDWSAFWFPSCVSCVISPWDPPDPLTLSF